MRRIAIINQKGGVGKTTTAVNLGAALARLGQRVLVIDMDPQANASMNLAAELESGEPSTYTLLTQSGRVADTLRGTSTPGLSVLPAHLDLSGAELELASAIGRESILKDALDEWEREETERSGRAPVDVILIDNPPSLGLLSVNGLAASNEVLIAVQTEFFALQGLSKLVEVVQLLRRRMNPKLEITGVLACLYDSRLRLAREVLAELRKHFPSQLFKRPIAQNVKLAETPSFARTIFEYAPESRGADDYLTVAREFLQREGVETEGEVRSLEVPPPPAPGWIESPPVLVGQPPMVPHGRFVAEIDAPEPVHGEPSASTSYDVHEAAASSELRPTDALSLIGDAPEGPETQLEGAVAVLDDVLGDERADASESPPEPVETPLPKEEEVPKATVVVLADEVVSDAAGELSTVMIVPGGSVEPEAIAAVEVAPRTLRRAPMTPIWSARGEERRHRPSRGGPAALRDVGSQERVANR